MSYTERYIFELQQKVAKLERQVAFLLQHLGLEYSEEPNIDVSPEILALAHQGKTLEAIKLFREETGADLKTAKEFIESLVA